MIRNCLNLSADTVNFTSSNSSVKKGETLVDTLRNIEAMKIDIVVVRHKGTGVPKFLADNSKAIIVNAGDGAHEHPTQALLDMLTVEEKLGTLEGKNVTIVGDIRHSRVARSNLWGMTTMGAHVTQTEYEFDLDEIGIDKLSADGTIHLKLEWLPHDGNPAAANGRAIATGPYVSKFLFHTKEVAIAPTANKKHRAGTVKKQNKEKRISMGYRRIK